MPHRHSPHPRDIGDIDVPHLSVHEIDARKYAGPFHIRVIHIPIPTDARHTLEIGARDDDALFRAMTEIHHLVDREFRIVDAAEFVDEMVDGIRTRVLSATDEIAAPTPDIVELDWKVMSNIDWLATVISNADATRANERQGADDHFWFAHFRMEHMNFSVKMYAIFEKFARLYHSVRERRLVPNGFLSEQILSDAKANIDTLVNLDSSLNQLPLLNAQLAQLKILMDRHPDEKDPLIHELSGDFHISLIDTFDEFYPTDIARTAVTIRRNIVQSSLVKLHLMGSDDAIVDCLNYAHEKGVELLKNAGGNWLEGAGIARRLASAPHVAISTTPVKR